MRAHLLFLLLLVQNAVASREGGRYLRGVGEQNDVEEDETGEQGFLQQGRGPRQERKLQRLFTSVVNSLISIGTPRMQERLPYLMKTYFSTYDFSWTTEDQWLGEEAFLKKSTSNLQRLPSICDPLAGDVQSFVTFEQSIFLSKLVGLEVMQIEKIEYVEDSAVIDLDLGVVRNSADWSSQWLVETSFDNLTASTMSILKATVLQPSCGMGAAEVAQTVVNGTILFANVNATTTATVTGETGRVALFVTTSTFDTMAIDEMSFRYDPIDTTTMGTFDFLDLVNDTSTAASLIRSSTNLTVTGPWGTDIDNDLQKYEEMMFTYVVEDELNIILPRPFINAE